MSNDYYVYLLVDVDGPNEDVFYVGKGVGARGAEHLIQYTSSVASGSPDATQLQLAEGKSASSGPEGEPGDAADVTLAAEESAKVERIREAHARGREVRVDFLRTALSESEAFLVESAVIDAIGLTSLTNIVHGHDHGRVPVVAALQVIDAEPVTVTEPGYQVVLTGGWGGGNSIAGLIGASEEAIWDNARRSWSIGPGNRAAIETAYRYGEPLILVAVSKGPSSTLGGLILGLWEIQGVERSSDRVGPGARSIDGWAYLAAPEGERVRQLRRKYLRKRSTAPRQVGPVRVGRSE